LTERGNTGRAEDFTLVRFQRDVAPGEIVAVATDAADEKALIAA
jgi:threonylcarbamoyladenosine tRNA methylthiotransferase MtaB